MNDTDLEGRNCEVRWSHGRHSWTGAIGGDGEPDFVTRFICWGRSVE